jgi:hypothetical protein
VNLLAIARSHSFATEGRHANPLGWITEIAYLPFSYGGPSFWPWLNARIGVQYTFFNKFDGATTNFNGNGRNAHNNNTLFVYTWIAF